MIKSIIAPLSLLFLVGILFFGCKKNEAQSNQTHVLTEEKEPFFKLSLAQWSLHRAIGNNDLDAFDFAEKAKSMGFEGIEYVSNLYRKKIETMGMEAVLEILKEKSEAHGVKNVLIMVDEEGHLSSPDEKERIKAIENHKKWVDAAQFLGCHAIRVNLYGSGSEEEWISNSTIGLTQLAEYGKSKGINVIVENHGGFSSNAALLAKVMKTVNMDNCGTLPDFGNFCIKYGDGTCAESYDKYKGIEEMMPFAKGVSAKSYDFDANGNETTLDYPRFLKIVKDAGFTGYIGVEYEGGKIGEEKGIELTRALLLKIGKELAD